MSGSPQSLADVRRHAEKVLPAQVAAFITGGTGRGWTSNENERAYDRVTFRPAAATPVSDPSLALTLWGMQLSMPLLTAPTGGAHLVHPEGDRAIARATCAAGTVHVLSTLAGHAVEDVSRAAGGELLFQLYYPGSRAAAEPLIARAHASSCRALVVTVDAAVPPFREGSRPRSRPSDSGAFARLAVDLARHPRWAARFLRAGAHRGAPMVTVDEQAADLWRGAAAVFHERPRWSDMPWIREQWSSPLIVKGVLSGEDARRAVSLGADGVIVSNHGGNVLDGTPATLDVLPEIVAAVGAEVPIALDGGIRRGSDVVKALALGARAVLVGRATLWGLALGEEGVLGVLEILRNEIARTLVALGCESVDTLDETFVRGSRLGT